MTADNVFKFCRAYKMFYQDKYDFKKYGGSIRTPPLLQQHDRRFYYRIAQKLNDSQIHALFTIGYFHNPNAYVTDLTTPEAFTAAVTFASRGENGHDLLAAELYELGKRLRKLDIDAWLYGEIISGRRTAQPGCLQDIVSGDLAPDLAVALLLIPQPTLQYAWAAEMSERSSTFGPGQTVAKLRKIDQLLYRQRPGWRNLTHTLAKEFWASTKYKTLAPKPVEASASLF